MNTPIDLTLANRMRADTGLPVTTHVLELVFPIALAQFQAAADEGQAGDLENNFLIPAIKTLWAEFQKSGGKTFDDFVQQRLAKSGDPLLRKFFDKRETVQADLDSLKSFYETGMNLRAAVQASTANREAIINQLAQAESDLGNHGELSVEKSVSAAAEIYHVAHRNPRDLSIFNNAIDHATRAPILKRVLTARIALLKSRLAGEETKIKTLNDQLKVHVA